MSARSLRGVDAVLVSHAHYDHLDLPSLERLGKKLPVVVPARARRAPPQAAFESVLEVEQGETFAIGELQIRAVPAEHDRSRAPFGASADPVGYVVAGSKSVYFAGDTDLFDGMTRARAGRRRAHPDLGVGAGLGGGGHLDPTGAARGGRAHPAGLVIPIHWGTYFPIHLGLAGRPAFVDLPPAEFAAA